MKQSLRAGWLALILLLFIPEARAQMRLVRGGKAVARIELADTTAATRRAGELLNLFIQRISGATLPTTPLDRGGKGSIVIGSPTDKAGHDGYYIHCADGHLEVSTGGGKGAVYGVCSLLERYLGVSYFARDAWSVTPGRDVELPAISWADTPAFRYRQTQSYGTADRDYYDWYRLEEPREVFINNMWVHTFDRLMPASVYGQTHPEYYSYINGERRPGNHSQWCLTNPAVFELVCHRLDSIFAANPGLKMISVSQNDGNNTQCVCPECKKVEAYEGSPSGNIIRFVNKLAARYPDKEFSTLAYLFSMQPPRHVKPLPNVNIMLCDIDCKREVPLTDNASGHDFVRALEGWSRISNNLFIWDYGINFDNYLSPFPNFHIIQANLKLFKKHHATMVFEQCGGALGTDFSELRAYMFSKLMWNPEADADSLMQTFLKGYYGEAAPYLYRYLQVQAGALVGSGVPLWIYDSPITHKNGMLKPYLRRVYNELFDQAEKAVSADTTRLRRVRIARLPLQYSELEIARTQPGGDREALTQAVKLFGERTAAYGVTQLNERNNRPDDYCKLYLKRFLPDANNNLAHGARIIWKEAPADRYRQLGDTALTDGLYGGTTYVESWVGWEGHNADFVIDMGEARDVHTISADFLHQLGAWVLLPKSVTYSVSTDNEHYTPFGHCTFAEDRDVSVKFKQATATAPEGQPVKVRYIRVEIEGVGMCPSWHYGVGYPAWFFLDEVMVN